MRLLRNVGTEALPESKFKICTCHQNAFGKPGEDRLAGRTTFSVLSDRLASRFLDQRNTIKAS